MVSTLITQSVRSLKCNNLQYSLLHNTQDMRLHNTQDISDMKRHRKLFKCREGCIISTNTDFNKQ